MTGRVAYYKLDFPFPIGRACPFFHISSKAKRIRGLCAVLLYLCISNCVRRDDRHGADIIVIIIIMRKCFFDAVAPTYIYILIFDTAASKSPLSLFSPLFLTP